MTISARELANQRIERLAVPKEYKNFVGRAPDNVQFKVLLSGPTTSGKSSFLYKLMNKFSRNGWRTLYGNFEENPKVGTIKEKLDSLKIRNENIDFIEDKNLDNFFNDLETGNYKFAVVDSLSVLCDSKAEIKNFFEIIETRFPTIPFFIVIHYKKDSKNYYGSTYLQHDVDIFWETKNGEVFQRKNRFINSDKKPTMKIWK